MSVDSRLSRLRISVRAAKDADLSQCLELMYLYSDYLLNPPQVDTDVSWWISEMSPVGDKKTCPRTAIGIALWRATKSETKILGVAVDQFLRRAKVATRLIDAIDHWSSSTGRKRMTVQVDVRDLTSCQFFKSRAWNCNFVDNQWMFESRIG